MRSALALMLVLAACSKKEPPLEKLDPKQDIVPTLEVSPPPPMAPPPAGSIEAKALAALQAIVARGTATRADLATDKVIYARFFDDPKRGRQRDLQVVCDANAAPVLAQLARLLPHIKSELEAKQMACRPRENDDAVCEVFASEPAGSDDSNDLRVTLTFDGAGKLRELSIAERIAGAESNNQRMEEGAAERAAVEQLRSQRCSR